MHRGDAHLRMPYSSCLTSTLPQQLLSQARADGHSCPKTCTGVPPTPINPRSSLPIPTTSMSGHEAANTGSYGPLGAERLLASPTQVPKPVLASKKWFQEVCEWRSEIDLETSASDNQDYEGTSGWIHCSQMEPMTARARVSPPKATGPGSSELDPEHIFGSVVGELTRTAVEKFGSMHLSPSRKRSISPGPATCRKRSRSGSCQDSSTSGLIGASEATDPVRVTRPAQTAPRMWPCPFFVRDKDLHRSCLTRHCFLSVDEVRKHLCTEHLEPIHCSVCYKTFQTIRLRDEHMRSRECDYELPYGFDGLRDSQLRDLQKQGTVEDKATILQERQWVKLWCIVFSCTRRPQSPFSFSRQELAVYEFRRFWESHGEHIIANVLAEHGLQRYDIANEERSLEALSHLVADNAVDYLLLTHDTRAP